MELRAQGRRDLDDLYSIEGFKEFCVEQINSKHFINTEVRKDIANGDHLFNISWLLIADYMENREFAFRNAPASGPDFESKASYKALNKWSYTLWENGGKGNPQQMDRIVEFCGRTATIGLCPPNPTTGLQRPAAVSSVMTSFYSMGLKASKDGGYNRDLQDSLDRLIQDKQEIVDEWKSYCESLASSWNSQIRPYWNRAFHHAFQEGKSTMIKFWESAGK